MEHETSTCVLRGGPLNGRFAARCSCGWLSPDTYALSADMELARVDHELDAAAGIES